MVMAASPIFNVKEASVFSRSLQTRIPFRFGKATMTHFPVLHLRLKVKARSGEAITGVSAIGIPPLWFDKQPGKTHEDNIRDLSLSLQLALEEYSSLDPAAVWELHRVAEPRVRRRAAAAGLNDLCAGFGVALVDLALVDAACRHAGISFHAALRGNVFGLGPGLEAFLPPEPLESVAVRHTVGLADVLNDYAAANPLQDGLPETLEDVIRQYRVGYFKIKISGDAEASRDRLRQVAEVLDRHAGDYRATLDGNEDFRDMAEFAVFIGLTRDDPALANLWRRVLWMEQPVEREASLHESARDPLREVTAFKPVIIDESDGTDDAFDRALALGYRGVSAKNCKGIFRTLHNFRRIGELRAQASGNADFILSCEDLTNVPIVPLHQDLCVAAALGVSHCERNGHHYVAGFRFLSPREKEDALREFPSLYRVGSDGLPALRIENGRMHLKEINRWGFGAVSEPDWENLEPRELSGLSVA